MTSIEVIDKIFSLLTTGGITGSMFKQKHPDTRPSEYTSDAYIVINSLPLSGEYVSNVIVNVNCHVKDADQKRGIPNLSLINLMAGQVKGILDGHVGSGMSIVFQQDHVIREEDNKEHYMNNRFEVNILN